MEKSKSFSKYDRVNIALTIYFKTFAMGKIVSNIDWCVCISLFAFIACKPVSTAIPPAENAIASTDLERLEFTVEEAPEWNALFVRTSGWFGADGAYSIPLNGKENVQANDSTKTLWLFSDTMIGETEGGELQPGWGFVNNTVAYLKGNKPDKDKISFHWAKDEEGNRKTLFTPGPSNSATEKKDWYWMGDGFVNTEQNNTLYLFAHRMRNLDNGQEWGFEHIGTTIIAIPEGSTPPFKDHKKIETPLHLEGGGWGAGIYVNTEAAAAPEPDGFVYVYGVGSNNLKVARVKPENFETVESWKFWDGVEWAEESEKAASVTQNVSNELSVTALPDGRYAVVFQENGLSPNVSLRLGLTPYGPFGPIIQLYKAKEMQQKNYATYNAKAHPHLSKQGELLISYNVNAFDILNEINSNPNLYRPKFIRVKLK